MDHVISRA